MIGLRLSGCWSTCRSQRAVVNVATPPQNHLLHIGMAHAVLHMPRFRVRIFLKVSPGRNFINSLAQYQVGFTSHP